MNEMRKLMEAIEKINESDVGPEQSWETHATRHITDSPDSCADCGNDLSSEESAASDYCVDCRKPINEVASSDQWEIAINNLIGEGDKKYGIHGSVSKQPEIWEWVRSELHGMLDFQPDESGLTSLDRWPSDGRTDDVELSSQDRWPTDER